MQKRIECTPTWRVNATILRRRYAGGDYKWERKDCLVKALGELEAAHKARSVLSRLSGVAQIITHTPTLE